MEQHINLDGVLRIVDSEDFVPSNASNYFNTSTNNGFIKVDSIDQIENGPTVLFEDLVTLHVLENRLVSAGLDYAVVLEADNGLIGEYAAAQLLKKILTISDRLILHGNGDTEYIGTNLVAAREGDGFIAADIILDAESATRGADLTLGTGDIGNIQVAAGVGEEGKAQALINIEGNVRAGAFSDIAPTSSNPYLVRTLLYIEPEASLSAKSVNASFAINVSGTASFEGNVSLTDAGNVNVKENGKFIIQEGITGDKYSLLTKYGALITKNGAYVNVAGNINIGDVINAEGSQIYAGGAIVTSEATITSSTTKGTSIQIGTGAGNGRAALSESLLEATDGDVRILISLNAVKSEISASHDIMVGEGETTGDMIVSDLRIFAGNDVIAGDNTIVGGNIIARNSTLVAGNHFFVGMI
ncbi:MAG: hypothetical protein LBR22_05065 [Desulfovibrio sp.]|nr:hypothetical protein [Desulfovibrio sp.]